MRTVEEKRLKVEQFKNELRSLEAQLSPEAIERLEVMLGYMDKLFECKPELIEGYVKRLGE